ELVLDLLDHHRSTGGDNRDQRKMLPVLGLRDSQRLDIVAAPRKQADHPRQHAWLVIDQDRQRVCFRFLRRRRGGIMGRGGSVHQTITFPSSVTASSTATPASP